jgi:hypothetical protein
LNAARRGETPLPGSQRSSGGLCEVPPSGAGYHRSRGSRSF